MKIIFESGVRCSMEKSYMKVRVERYKKKCVLCIINHVFKGTRPIFYPLKRNLLNWAGFRIGKNTRVVGPIFCTADFSVGDNCWIGRNMSIDGNGFVEIGNNCDIAPNVQFYTGSHVIGNEIRRAGKGYNTRIKVGNGCWLGAASIVLPGVKIGNSVVVAAGSVIVASTPFMNDILIGGVPAKVIKILE